MRTCVERVIWLTFFCYFYRYFYRHHVVPCSMLRAEPFALSYVHVPIVTLV